MDFVEHCFVKRSSALTTNGFDQRTDRTQSCDRRKNQIVLPARMDLKMDVARMRKAALVLFAVMWTTTVVGSLDAKDSVASKKVGAVSKKDATAPKAIRCCGMIVRTDFGHPDRLAEMSVNPDVTLANCIDSGKTKGLIEAFDIYFQEVEMELGDATERDQIRSRLNQVFKSVANDQARSAQLLEGFRRFSFASVLASKGLSARAIEEVRQSRVAFLRAVPADSFCLMPVELYLATALADTGETAEGISIAQGVVNRARAAFGPKDEFVGLALAGLGKAQLAADKPNLAEASLRESMGILADALEIQPNAYLLNCNVLAEAMLAQSKNAETVELMAYLEPEIRKLFLEQLVPPVFNVVMIRAKALVALERYDEAEKVLGRFPEIIQSVREPGTPGRDLLLVYVTLLEKTDRAVKAPPIRKCIARIDARLASADRR